MARYCRLCNRPKDAEHHDVAETVDVEATVKAVLAKEIEPDELLWKPLPPGAPNRWACRVSLVGTGPITGKAYRMRPHPRRIVETDARYVHNDRLKPGGDLHHAELD